MNLASSDNMVDKRQARRRRLAVVMLVALIAAAIGWGSNAFVGREDSILRFPEVAGAKHLPEIFSADFTKRTQGQYAPLPYAMLALPRTIVPAQNAWFWPAWLAAFHILNGLLVYWIARRFLRDPWSPVVAAAVFLLHPAASAFLSQPNLFPAGVATTCWLGGLACYLRGMDTQARGRALALAGAVVIFAAGLLASRVLMTLPLLILLLEVVYFRARVLRIVGMIAPFAAIIVLYAVYVAPVGPTTTYFVHPPAPPEGSARAWIHGFASGGIDRLVAPVRLSSLPPTAGVLHGGSAAPSGFSDWSISFLWLVLIALAAVLAWRSPRRALLVVGLWLALAALAPEMAAWWSLTVDRADWLPRLLPLAGLAMLAGATTEEIRALGRPTLAKMTGRVAAAAALIMAAALAWAQVDSRSPERYWRGYLASHPKSEVASLELGRAELTDGNAKAAWTHLFGPQMTAVRESCITAALHYARTGDSTAAVVHLSMAEREMEYGLTIHSAMRRRAEAFLEMGAWDYADQYLGQALMIEPKDAAALRLLARVFETKGFVKAAEKCLIDASAVDPSDPDTARDLAAIEERLSRPAFAESPVRVSPPSPELLRYAIDQGEPETVRARVIALADTHPDDPVIQLSAGIAAARDQQHEKALALIDRSIRGLPAYSYTWASRCWALANAGRADDARAAMKRVPNSREWDALTWQQFGYTLAREEKLDFAIETFEFALQREPEMPEAHNNVGLLLAWRGKNEEALPHLRRALALPIEKRGPAHNALGCVLMSLGKTAEAEEHLARAVELEPKRSRGYHNLAQLYAGQGRFLDVERVLADGARAVPDDLPLRITLAWMLATAPHASERNGERAVRVAESALKRCPPRQVPPELMDALAAGYAESGHFDAALEVATRAASMARRMQKSQLASDIDQRAELYRIHSPFHVTAQKRAGVVGRP